MFNQNNQKYKESESVVLNLEVLSMKYKNLLLQYKQAITDYISYLTLNNSKSLSSVTGQAFWGSGPAAGTDPTITNVTSVTDCANLCLQNSSCTGATFNPTAHGQPLCWLRTGEAPSIPTIPSDYAILPTEKLMLLNIQNINNQLTTVNKSILEKIQNSNSIYAQQSTERSQNAQEMLQQYMKLNEEREKIERMVNSFETLDQSQIQGNIKVSENYYSFILLFVIAICVVILLYKFSDVSVVQKGGDGEESKKYYIIFALILVSIVIYYYSFIYNYTAGLLSAIGSFLSNTLRL